ncbi:MAG: hypothetical protein KGQ41_08045 [Alphaproteobacteria bacterium]|nr:hypothetical protein [Alphaproteobacteria bacterium]
MQKNDTYEFRTYIATIIESNTWTETHVSGNTLGSSAITSSSRTRQKVWLRDDHDGTEFESELTASRLACRVGHKLLFVHGKSLRKSDDKYEKLLAIKNLNTGQTFENITTHGDVISDTVPFSFSSLLLFIFLLFIANLDVLDNYSGLLFTIAFAAPLTISYFRHRAPRLLFDALLKEKLAEYSIRPSGEETINIKGAMA